MKNLLILATVYLTVLAYPHAAQAQVTIQQPVFNQFGIATGVVVPDRGSAYIGGIGRVAESRTSNGPFYRRSSVGREVSHGGMHVHVYIHDFEETDRMILEQADRETSVLHGTKGISRSDAYEKTKSKTVNSRNINAIKQKPASLIASRQAQYEIKSRQTGTFPVEQASNNVQDVYSIDQLREELEKKSR